MLPVISLALPQIAYIARLTRGSMIEVLRSDYIRTARAQGLPTREVIVGHALKPALVPIISYLGPATAGIITGSVVIEQIFGVPGLGRYFVQGALNRDYTLVMGIVVFYGVLIILFNFLVDLAYHLVRDAEARYGNSVDVTPCRLLEVDLLEHNLNKPEAAAELMEALLEDKGGQAFG